MQHMTPDTLKGEGAGVLSLNCDFREVIFGSLGHKMARGTNKGHYTHLKALLKIFIQEM